jgi:hypothetical protein
MAEIDWDKIIKAARSKKEEEDKAAVLERRLHRMERILDKLASEKSSESSSNASGHSQPQEYHPAIQRHPESDRKDFAPKVGFSLPKLSFGSKAKHEEPAKAHHGAGKSRFAIPASITSPSRRTIAAIGALAVVLIFSGAFLTGNLSLNLGADNPLTGLFGAKPSKPSMMYVCGDGITTVENLTMCPTTSTTSSIETTTIATTTVNTTSTSSTTTSIGAKHSIALKEASCNGASITVKLTNSGTDLDNSAYLKFYIDGTENTNVICTPLTMGPGETVTCISSGSLLTGTHSVKVAGLVNVVTATVFCG